VTAIEEAEEQIIDVVQSAGGVAYAVGGSVRDGLLGLSAKDNDYLVTGVPVDNLSAALTAAGFKVDLVGKSFGVIKATRNGVTYDIALPRTERSTGSGHRDFEVNADPTLTVEDDLSRRDFTVNAIAIRLSDGAIIDPFHGQEDLKAKVIRAVGKPSDRFTEDPLRMFRAIRFVAKLGFRLDHQIQTAIQELAGLATTLAPERIQEELFRLLSYEDPGSVFYALALLEQSKLLHAKFPLDTMSTQASFRPEIVAKTVALKAPLVSRLSAFIDGIPKGDSFLEALKVSNEIARAVSVIGSISDSLFADMLEVDLREAVARCPSFELFEAAVRVSQATELASGSETRIAAANSDAETLLARARPLAWLHGFDAAKVAVSGTDIATEFNVSGRSIGELKKAAAVYVIEGRAPNEREAVLAALKNVVAERGMSAIRRTVVLRYREDE
jgi:tRNA nucleotidyltransferase/poly(A) polymerase